MTRAADRLIGPFSFLYVTRRGSDEFHISKGFDALMQTRPDFANRISYVVAPNGTVAYFYQSLNPAKHVETMLAAVTELPQNSGKK